MTATDLGRGEVTKEEIDAFCDERNLKIYGVFRKSNENIDDIFEYNPKEDSMVLKNEIVLRTYGDFLIKNLQLIKIV